jgi:DNA-binding Xre family transcriptional regulator
MITEEIKIDLTEIKEKKSRDSVKSLFLEKGIAFQELYDFWSNFKKNENDITDNAIVFSDLHSLVKHVRSINHENWAFRVKKRNPYFISFIRNNRDEKLADLIDDLLKASYNRLTVIDATHHFNKKSQKEKFINEINNIVLRNYNPESIKNVSLNKNNQSLLVEFIDGDYGEVSFKDLQLEDFVDQLLLDSLKINEKGNSIEIFTKDGEIFDIDSVVLKSLISSDIKNDIKEQTQLTADNVGKRLSLARKKSNITQKELSELINIDQAIISKIETGKHLPRFDTLERIAKGLELSVSELLNIN